MNSYFNDIEYQINKQIKFARNRILVAVAWFTNSNIGNELIKKKNVDIEIVVDDNLTNRNSLIIKKLQENNIEVTFIKDIQKNYYLMHNKFCVIDSKIVLTGSYNWTNNANSNDENITVLEDNINANHYTQEFRRIKNLEYSNDKIFLTNDEINNVTEIIYLAFKELLKSNLTDLKIGLLANWTNENVKNQIRRLNETTRNNLKDRIEKFHINLELVSKYGIENFSSAKEEDKIEIKDRIKKEGLSEIEYYLELELNLYKLKAIKKIQDNYMILFKTNINDEEITNRISKVFVFLSKERFSIINKSSKKK